MAAPHSKYFAPNYTLIINGKVMGPEFMKMVDSATFEDESELMSSLKFKIRYKANTRSGVSDDIMNTKIIGPGNNVVLRGGYGNDIVDIGAGYITNLEPDFSENSDPTISIVCYDNLYKMSKRKSASGEVFSKYKDSKIAYTLGEKHGFVVEITDSSSSFGIRQTHGVKIRTQKRGSSDLDFLKELAKLNSYDLYCKWDSKKKRYRLFFESPKDQTKEVMTFVYGRGDTPYDVESVNDIPTGKLLSFKPTLTIGNQFTKYEVHSWDKKGGKKITHSITMDEYMNGQEDLKFGGVKADGLLKSKSTTTSGAGVTKKAFGTSTEVVSTRVFGDEEEAQKYLMNHMHNLAKDFITGSCRVSGNQYIRSRQVHKFDGLGAYFNGKYFIKKVSHTFNSSSYSCNLNVRKVLREIAQ